MWPLKSLTLLTYLSYSDGLNLHIEGFYSRSFVPDHIHIAYHIERFEVLNFNFTVERPFPGRLLMHIFARKLSDQVGGFDQADLVRFKNLDVCKLLDAVRNMTLKEIQGESLLPSTFFVSCPLVPGFYYVKNATVDVNLFPFRLPEGRYMALFEMIQVYEEVMKLVTARIKFAMRRPPGYKEPSVFDSSEEDTHPGGDKKESPNEAEEEKQEQEQEPSSEVTDPSDDNYEAEAGKIEPSSEGTDQSPDYFQTSTKDD